MSVPLPARLYGPGSPLPWTPGDERLRDVVLVDELERDARVGDHRLQHRHPAEQAPHRVGHRLRHPHVGDLLDQRLRLRAGDDAGPEDPRLRPLGLQQHLAEDALDLGLLRRVEVGVAAARRDVLVEPVRVVVVEAVGGDARRVTDALGAGGDRGLEHVPRAVDVDPARAVARLEDRERQVDDHVGALHGVVDALPVLDVALAVLRLLPALRRGVERAPRHADDLLHLARALERVDERDPEVAGRAGNRDCQAVRRHGGQPIARLLRVSRSRSTRSTGSARTRSRPLPQSTTSRSPSSASTESRPRPVAIRRRPCRR